jgi:hypothetical protein
MSMVPPLTQLEPDQFCLIVLVGEKLPPKNPTKCNFSEFENLKNFSPEFPEFFLFEYEAHICYNKPI